MALYTKLILGNCLKQMAQLDDNSIDSIVTDPPYGLSFMGKKWDYDVPSVDIWSECLRVLKPGGHLLAFAGTRTQHRMAVNIEDAGFEIRDMIAWVYGSGFPKSMDVSKAIDMAAGAEREVVVGSKLGRPGMAKDGSNQRSGFDAAFGEGEGSAMDHNVYAPATEAAKQWEGWGTALKPALEPITVARKPIKGTVADNVLKWGTGGLNIDECRVGNEDLSTQWDRTWNQDGSFGNGKRSLQRKKFPPGRFPANLIHDGSDEVEAVFPQTGKSRPDHRNEPSSTGDSGIYGKGYKRQPNMLNDSGSASRFFYCAKASKSDRDEGLEVFEKKQTVGGGGGIGDYIDDVNSASGKFGSEKAPSKNHHPTVKPTDLMRYLVKLVTPPEGVVLDPFMGSGSTGKACVSAGFSFIGIEMEQEYIDIAKARIEREKKKGIQSDLF